MKLPFVIKINFVTICQLFSKYILRRKPHNYNFGLIPDKWDGRDIYYKVRRFKTPLPSSTYRKNIDEFQYRYDQGNLGSCVGNGICYAFRRVLQVNKMPDFDPSRLFAYYIAREDKDADTGASIRNGFKAINKFGICWETTWPYVISKFTVDPPDIAFQEALDHQSIRYERIYPVTKDSIRDAISNGFPVVYGKQLYESFMSDHVAQTGLVPVPRTCREQLAGGHCMIIMDYDEDGTIELNSWGRNWGMDGVCHIPWEYVLNDKLCSDFWVLNQTE